MTGDEADKADATLRRLLQSAPETEEMTVVGVLDAGAGVGTAPPEPDAFASQIAYRRALIEHASVCSGDGAREIVEQLRHLGLSVMNEGLSSSVVFRGRPAQIREALRLPGMRSLHADRPLDLIQPIRPPQPR